MAYIRRKGNQLALVHGERDAETGKVEQRVLFTLYSKAEALEAIGRGSGGKEGGHRFRSLLEREYPGIRFNWDKVRQGIEENLEHLPDLYQYRQSRCPGQFREDLIGFARQLILTDPYHLESSAKAIADNRHELEYLCELIRWRLDHCDQKKSEWNADNPFYWRFALRGREVPPDIEAEAAGYFENKEYEKAKAIFRMLIDAFDDYAEGYNYLGLIALEKGEIDEAIINFGKTTEVGRKLFPKCLAKKHYWVDLATRPYIRGLRNLLLSLNRAGKYIEALEICEKLDRECGDADTAQWYRAAIYLNTGCWESALENAEGVIDRMMPDAAFIAGLALSEAGETKRAVPLFLHGILHHPRAARILAGIGTGEPIHFDQVNDHNAGKELLENLQGYLSDQSLATKRFYERLLMHPIVCSIIEEMDVVISQSHERDYGGWRNASDRMNEMRSADFIRAQAQRVEAAL
ncbi:MAG: tetratricopeptide repeat protein [Candidatus Thiodiazotropha sp. (ex Epidulcina cf. delphinae)]|nr:tetratricopeptide repeat protein [Candidatus Thiodiazotropha sp. (ex Epidulcina cf. delphinae)]